MSGRSSRVDQSLVNDEVNQPTRLDKPAKNNDTSGAHTETPPTKRATEVTGDRPADAPRPARQRFVFTDSAAFRYLEEDTSTSVLERHGRLEGYELYLVEQWACSRVHPTFVITTYTGDPSHAVTVGVLSVPLDEEAWSSRLKVYFRAVSQYHARRKDTPLGVLMVTNLSGFPSALTVITVPDGDIKKHREDFIVNENLKRLGCSGRAGLTLSAPTGATLAKFHQLYHTSDRVPLYNAVLELVKLCQVALMMFDLLGAEYADGLLCDVTERAINDWWTQVGTEIFNLEPSDGILGPTTVAALLGMLTGARNRLNTYGAPVGKDAFDIPSLKRGVAYFQKSQKLTKTRRLDRQTLQRLHRVTAKAASGEGWMVPKAVKSTVAELSGKGGEMVMGMVGARDKAGIGEVETLDIERFVQLVHGERCKWLWYGKPRKSLMNEGSVGSENDEALVFGQSSQGGYFWSGKRRDSGDGDDVKIDGKPKETFAEVPNRPTFHSANTGDLYLEKDTRAGTKHKKHESRSGFGRIKDAVGISGLRGHHKHSRDDSLLDKDERSRMFHLPDDSRGALSPTKSFISPSPPRTSKELALDAGPIRARMEELKREKEAEISDSSTADLRHRRESAMASKASLLSNETAHKQDATTRTAEAGELSSKQGYGRDPSYANGPSFMKEDVPARDHERNGEMFEISKSDLTPYLRRTQSHSRYISQRLESTSDDRWQRRLSFSIAEEAIFTWDDIGVLPQQSESDQSDLKKAMRREEFIAGIARDYYDRMARLREKVEPWVKGELENVESLDSQAIEDLETLNDLYHQHLEEYQMLSEYVQTIFASEKTNMTDIIKDLEVLGAKLEYELNTLSTKVRDVEDGVTEFEKQVSDAETRAHELELEERSHESWMHWALRVSTGVGKPPSVDLQ
ncbi:MAG: ERAD-associated protein [Chaenotheca gracillima]|nr:MAG: ERAD-associated protein [Chaenotheca gracillima]